MGLDLYKQAPTLKLYRLNTDFKEPFLQYLEQSLYKATSPCPPSQAKRQRNSKTQKQKYFSHLRTAPDAPSSQKIIGGPWGMPWNSNWLFHTKSQRPLMEAVLPAVPCYQRLWVYLPYSCQATALQQRYCSTDASYIDGRVIFLLMWSIHSLILPST